MGEESNTKTIDKGEKEIEIEIERIKEERVEKNHINPNSWIFCQISYREWSSHIVIQTDYKLPKLSLCSYILTSS